jgi:hypothetical protein
MNPQAVARKQIAYLRDGQRDRSALYMDVDLRAREIECRALGLGVEPG